MPGLLVTDRDLLLFEQRRHRQPGAGVAAMREELGLTPAGYVQRLLLIADEPTPEIAVEFGPLLNQLRRRGAGAGPVRAA